MVVLSSPGARPLHDAALARTDGSQVHLSTTRGRPTVLLYEDRNSADLNPELKKELFERAKARGLLQAAHLVAVANLAVYDWFPARGFAESAVRDAEVRFGIPIWIDWKGVLSTHPWKLPSRTATVLVLDRRGCPTYRASGRLDRAERERLFAAIEAEIDRSETKEAVTQEEPRCGSL
jgi:hypothetical protein